MQFFLQLLKVNHQLRCIKYLLPIVIITLLITGEVKPSVSAFDAIVSGPLSQFLACSSKLAGDVQAQVYLFP